jgi:hypothetical protein
MKMRALLIVIVVAVAACSNAADTVPAQQTIGVDRSPVVLPNAYMGTVQKESLQILNHGRTDLTITSITLTQLDGGTLPNAAHGGFDSPLVAVDAGVDSDPLPVKIGGLGTGFVQFAWGPKTNGEATAKLTIQSNDPSNPVLTTTVAGCAVPTDGGPGNCVCPFDGGC